jgi:hypothetical protein
MHRHQRADRRAGGAVHHATVPPLAVLAQQTLDRHRGEVESGGVDVDEQGSRAGAGDGARGGKEGVGRGDDGIA